MELHFHSGDLSLRSFRFNQLEKVTVSVLQRLQLRINVTIMLAILVL